jgi:hypothetical protein
MGTDYRELLGIPGRFTPWCADPADYWRALDSIWTLPLQDNAFCRSKSHIKALEYAARGIPSAV